MVSFVGIGFFVVVVFLCFSFWVVMVRNEKETMTLLFPLVGFPPKKAHHFPRFPHLQPQSHKSHKEFRNHTRLLRSRILGWLEVLRLEPQSLDLFRLCSSQLCDLGQVP